MATHVIKVTKATSATEDGDVPGELRKGAGLGERTGVRKMDLEKSTVHDAFPLIDTSAKCWANASQQKKVMTIDLWPPVADNYISQVRDFSSGTNERDVSLFLTNLREHAETIAAARMIKYIDDNQASAGGFKEKLPGLEEIHARTLKELNSVVKIPPPAPVVVEVQDIRLEPTTSLGRIFGPLWALLLNYVIGTPLPKSMRAPPAPQPFICDKLGAMAIDRLPELEWFRQFNATMPGLYRELQACGRLRLCTSCSTSATSSSSTTTTSSGSSTTTTSSGSSTTTTTSSGSSSTTTSSSGSSTTTTSSGSGSTTTSSSGSSSTSATASICSTCSSRTATLSA